MKLFGVVPGKSAVIIAVLTTLAFGSNDLEFRAAIITALLSLTIFGVIAIGWAKRPVHWWSSWLATIAGAVIVGFVLGANPEGIAEFTGMVMFVGGVAALALPPFNRSIAAEPDDQQLKDFVAAEINRADEIVTKYAQLLEDEPPGGTLRPISSLPAPKEEVKASLLKMLAYQRMRGNMDPRYPELIKTAYTLLARYVADEQAEQSHRMMSAAERARDAASNEEMRSHLRTFANDQAALESVTNDSIAEQRALAEEFEQKVAAMGAAEPNQAQR